MSIDFEIQLDRDFIADQLQDNRSVYHSATFDYSGLGSRTGQRAVSLGERPYLDPNSKGRREALGLDGNVNFSI